MNLINGGLVWVEDSLNDKLTNEQIEKFNGFLLNTLPKIKLSEMDTVLYDNLVITFRRIDLDSFFMDSIGYHFDVYEVSVNNTWLDFYIRENNITLDKTIVNQMYEFLPSHMKNVECYGTYDEWNCFYETLDVHFEYKKPNQSFI